jgi:hypothetical protein
MVSTIKVKRRLDSETVHLPEVWELIGREVEIVVRDLTEEGGETGDRYPLRGSVLSYEGPFEPLPEDDWEALA